MTDHVKILVIVEDEPDMRMMIRAILSSDKRIEVVGEAANSEEAIEAARTHDPGLIILDHQIEGDVMGVQLAPLLKEAAPSAKILLFSAFDMHEEAATEPAIDEFLPKSDIKKLLPTVRRLLDLE